MAINKKLDEASMTSMITGFLANKKDSMQRRNKKNSKNSRMEKFWSNINESLRLMNEAKEVKAKDPKTGELHPAIVVAVSDGEKGKVYKLKWKDESMGTEPFTASYKDLEFEKEKTAAEKAKEQEIQRITTGRAKSGGTPRLSDETDPQELGVAGKWRDRLPTPEDINKGDDIDQTGGISDKTKRPLEFVANTAPENEKKNKRIMSGSELSSKIDKKLQALLNSSPEFKREFRRLTELRKAGDKEASDQIIQIRARLGKKIQDDFSATLAKGSAANLSAASNTETVKKFLTPVAVKALQQVVDLTKKGQKIPTELSIFVRDILLKDVSKPDVLKAIISQFKDGEVKPESVAKIVNAASENFGNIAKFMNSRLDVYPGQFSDEIEDAANKNNVPGRFESPIGGIGSGLKKIVAPDIKSLLPTGETQKKKDETYKDVDGKVISRSRVGDTPIFSLADAPLDNITKLYSYFRENEPEIERATKERMSSMPFLSPSNKLPEPGKEVDKLSTIGSEFKDSVLDKDEAKKFPKILDAAEGGKTDDKLAAISVLFDVWNRLINVKPKNGRDPQKTSDFLADPIVKKLSEYAAKIFTTKEDPVSSYDVLLVLSQLVERDKLGRVVGMKKPEDAGVDDEDAVLATQLYQTLGSHRVRKHSSVGGPESDRYIGPDLKDFIGSESEKVTKNLPALEKDVLQKQANTAKEEQKEKDRLAAERKKRISPAEMSRQSHKMAFDRANHIYRLRNRRDELSGEEGRLTDEIRSAAGMDPELYKDLTDFLSLTDEQGEGNFESTFSPRINKKGKLKWDESVPEETKNARKFNRERGSIESAVQKIDKATKFSNISRRESVLKNQIDGIKLALKKNPQDPEAIQNAEKLPELEQKLASLRSKFMRPVPINSSGAIDPLAARIDTLKNLPSRERMYTPGESRLAIPRTDVVRPSSGKLPPPVQREKEREDALQLPTGDIKGLEVEPAKDSSDRSKIIVNPQFVHDKESRKDVQKRLFSNLVRYARKRVALKNEPLTPTHIISTIKTMFDRGKLPKKYYELKPEIEKMNRKSVDPTELGVAPKLEESIFNRSIMEFLTLPGKKGLVHADFKDDKDWSSASPVRKLKFDPKFEKQTKPNTKKKKAKGKTK